MIDKDFLLKVYSETEYILYDFPIIIGVNLINSDLDLLLTKKGVSSWAFLTAWNPGSRIFSSEENRRRNQSLKNKLSDYTLLDGAGKRGDWLEESFLVLGLSSNAALELAEDYEQNAVLVGSVGQTSSLLLTTRFR
ncbi:PF11697 family protein [Leptospira broomii serovar Hurstbridge str. 5399]|uniref:PF11697 family protein n=1 Tax=Leptospira broomii serovar Hurstbridge str. 5399 TaxID=1049789 RepID=T0FD14_9LEPT|nr:DUF3293 domain-containing protein [Leptospira broomii]EQA45761.1 PF11697 family protein [Leptospira broomii serovar Hurstbridge str. 5399]